jgi:four helix bundle protein
MKIKNYKDLNVWKQGIDIVNKIYDLTRSFPSEEKFSLTSQMQRAAVSIPSNIAEGALRQHTKEYIQFCHIALGSCAELQTQTVIAFNREYFSKQDFEKIESSLDQQMRMIKSMVSKLRLKKSNPTPHHTPLTKHYSKGGKNNETNDRITRNQHTGTGHSLPG